MEAILTRPEVAAKLGLKESTLKLWAAQEKGPQFIRLGLSPKSPVRFREGELLRYLDDPEKYERDRLATRIHTKKRS